MNLTHSQKQALNLSKNSIVEAGAGSGKTTVFVQRYLSYFKENPHLEPAQVLAITFTNLAAQELVCRIQNTLHTDEAYKEIASKLLSHLSQTSIMTIHGFCKHLLQQYPIESCVDPCFTILDDTKGRFLIDESIEEGLSLLAQENDVAYKQLHALYTYPQIVNLLKKCFEKKDCLDRYLSPPKSSYQHYLLALFSIFERIDACYQHKKSELGTLDYVDLLAKTKTLLLHAACLKDIQHYYQYILVDEFQDTDSNQWHIIQQLCDSFQPLSKRKLFLVGDIKQSIYGFRGAEADLFLNVFNQFDQDNDSVGIHMSDNFRSQAPIISFVNSIFSELFEKDPSSNIPYTPLKPVPKATKGEVQFCLSPEKTFGSEAHLLAHTIQHLLKKHPHYLFQDIAILFRRRQHFKHLKDIFFHYDLPVQIDYTPGFYQQPIIMDAYNLLCMLIEPHHRLAWFGALRSPVFNIDDDTLFLLKHVFSGASFFDMVRDFLQTPVATLLEKGFSKEATQSLCGLFSLFYQWQLHLSFDSISSGVTSVFNHTKAWSRYTAKQLNQLFVFLESCDDNLEKVCYHHKRFMQQLHFTIQTRSSPSLSEESTNAIQLLTIHASKGLEFPIVFIAECHHPFHLSLQDSLLFSSKSVALSHKQLNPKDKQPVICDLENDTKHEAKRLFYVACTRAMDFLFLSGHNLFNQDTSKNPISFFHMLKPIASIENNRLQVLQKSYTIQENFTPATQKPLKLPFETHDTSPQTLFFSNQAKPLPLYRLSVSDIELYMTCSKQLVYKEHFSSLPAPNVEKKGAHSSASLGTLTHKAFELFFSNTLGTLKESLSPWFITTGQQSFDTHLSFVEKQLNGLKKGPLFQLAFNASHLLPEHPFSLHYEGVLIEGRIDLVLQLEDQIIIIDYKTDGVLSEELSTFGQTYQTQLSIYYLALLEQFGNQKPIVCALYLTQSRVLLDVPLTDLSGYKQKLKELPQVLSQQAFKPPALDTCLSCSYYKLNPLCPKQRV